MIRVNQNTNLTAKYFDHLIQLNNESKNPGQFNHFEMDGTGRKGAFQRNTYSYNPKSFYKNINLNRHNWMTLNTVAPGKHNRADMSISNLMANYLDIDCLQNGIDPEDFMKRFKAYVKQPHKQDIDKYLKPTLMLHSGHGIYMIFLYKHPVDLQQLTPKAKRHALDMWKTRERSMVDHLNVWATKVYGKRGEKLGDIHSTNPARILRMPNTANVKNQDPSNKFTKPMPCYVSWWSGKYYDYDRLSKYIDKHYIPLFNSKFRQASLKTQPLRTKANRNGAGWQKILTAQTLLNHKDQKVTKHKKNYGPSKYMYSSFHPRFGHRAKYKTYNFTLLDYLADHNIDFEFAPTGKNIHIPDGQNNVNQNGGDLSSLTLTQMNNVDGKGSYTQMTRPSGKWNGVLDQVQANGKKLDSVTEFIMIQHGIYNQKIAHQLKYKWMKHYAAEGHTKTAFPYTEYGVGNAVKNAGRTQNNHTNKVSLKQGMFKDIILRKYEGLYKYNLKHKQSSFQKQAMQKHHIKSMSKADYDKFISQVGNMIKTSSMKRPHSALKKIVGKKATDITGRDFSKLNYVIQHHLNQGKNKDLFSQAYKKLYNFYNKQSMSSFASDYSHSVNEGDIKKQIKKASYKQALGSIDNNIARNYLIHRRKLSPELVNVMINRGLIRGIKGYSYYPNKKTKNGTIVKDYSHKVIKPDKVEFIQRKPRNAVEAHQYIKPNNKYYNGVNNDLRLMLQPDYVPKDGMQRERPAGADYIGVTKTKDTYTDANGKKHQIYNTARRPNADGTTTKDKLIDQHGDHYYGFNFKTGLGTGKLYVFEAPIDAISHFELQFDHYKDLVKNQPNNTKAIANAKKQFTNATYLSLGGSGDKTKLIQSFIDKQYAMGHDYSKVIMSPDNDWSGYSTTQQLASGYGNRKDYVNALQQPNHTQKAIEADVPVSMNRQPGQEILRYGADAKANGQKSDFNKDWNDEQQAHVDNNYNFKEPQKNLNMDQYSQMNTNQLYVDIQSKDSELQAKGQKVNPERDIDLADMALQASSKAQQGFSDGYERLDKDNPRIYLMNKAENQMSKPAKNLVNQYVSDVGIYMSGNEVGNYSKQSLQKLYHRSNPFMQNKAIKIIMKTPYRIAPLNQSIQNTLKHMQNRNAKSLYANALKAQGHLVDRHNYEKKYYFNAYRRHQYYNRYHKYPKSEYPEQHQIYRRQNKIDTTVKYACLKQIMVKYPKDFNQIVKTASIMKNSQKTETGRKNLANCGKYASQYLGLQEHTRVQPIPTKIFTQPKVEKLSKQIGAYNKAGMHDGHLYKKDKSQWLKDCKQHKLATQKLLNQDYLNYKKNRSSFNKTYHNRPKHHATSISFGTPSQATFKRSPHHVQRASDKAPIRTKKPLPNQRTEHQSRPVHHTTISFGND